MATKLVTLGARQTSGGEGPSGPSRRQTFYVVAASETEAMALLAASRWKVARGLAYRDKWGAVTDPFLVYRSISFKQLSPSPLSGAGTGLYELEATAERGEGDDREPTVDQPVWSWDKAERTVQAERDLAGTPIVNLRGEKLEVSITKGTRVLTFRKVVTGAVDLGFWFGFDDTVNDRDLMIKGRYKALAGTVLCLGVTLEERSATETVATARFELLRDSGDTFVPFKVPSYTVEDGVKKLLKLGPDGAVVTDDPAEAHVHEFVLWRTANLAAMGL